MDQGFAADARATREQVDTLQKQLSRLDDRARSREDELENTLSKLEGFYNLYQGVMSDINEVSCFKVLCD